ncbi:ankyrin repeat-containing domain protein [Lophiotrema nucula]|uniref:Ankyrin repeat-containing domain protein n=1 Tax=Lophiotrema nucula TaxID=690887 RepID=A0A6A5ZUA1_9PLEO|nr:ankyrin repeat-containing domain protein [Lophiotrema nucula]
MASTNTALANGQEVFGCEKCSKTFPTRKRYHQHMEAHTKPYSCQMCSKNFGRRRTRDLHVQHKHRVVHIRFTCPITGCQFRATRKDNLKQHQYRKHPEQRTLAIKEGYVEEDRIGLDVEKVDNARQATVEDSSLEDIAITNRSALLDAAASGRVTFMETLLEIGIDISVKGDDGSTALHCAARAGQSAAIRFALEKGAQVQELSSKGRTPLHEAILGKHFETVQELMTSGATVDRPSILYAVNLGNANLMTALVKGIDDGSWICPQVMVAVAKSRSAELLRTLLSKTDPDRRRRLWTEALKDAVEHGYIDFIRQMLQGGEVPELSPLLPATAMQFSHIEIVKLLLGQEKLQLSERFDMNGRYHTLLTFAVELGNEDLVQILLADPRVDINRNPNGQSALITAVNKGLSRIVKLLLEHPQISVEQTGYRSQNILIGAVGKGALEIVKLLLDHPSIDVNVEAWRGKSALQLAAAKGSLEIVKLLLDHQNIAVNHRSWCISWLFSCQGAIKTALDFAQENGHQEVADLLLARGALTAAEVEALEQFTEAGVRQSNEEPSIRSKDWELEWTEERGEPEGLCEWNKVVEENMFIAEATPGSEMLLPNDIYSPHDVQYENWC